MTRNARFGTTRARLLVVEDTRIIALDLQNLLTKLGYEVVAAVASGEEAVSKSGELRPHLVLMDIVLHGQMDGIEAVQLIRQRYDIPVVCLTDHADVQTLQRARVTEPYGYVLKPFQERELQIAIEMALDKHAVECRLRESERRFRAMVQTAADAFISLNGDGNVVFWNDAAEGMFGYPAAEVLGRSVEVIVPEESRTLLRQMAQQALAMGEMGSGSKPVEAVAVRKGGERFPVEFTLATTRSGHAPLFTAIVRDVSERKRAQEALRTSEERYALAAMAANDGLWDWDLKQNEVYYSSRWKSMFGCSEEEVCASPAEWFSRVHPEDIHRVKAEITAHLDGHTPHFESEHRVRHKDGSYLWVLCRGLAARNGDNLAERMAGSVSDITGRKRAEDQLLHDAFHDDLTGLPNRALFMDRLDHVLQRARRHKEHPFALLYLDLDRFKLINDSLGHAMGDKLLIASARRLEMCLRGGDTVARLGGDEFAVLMEDVEGEADVAGVADRIQSELLAPFDLDGREVFNSASMGVVMGPASYDRAEAVLRDADIAMYHAKAMGKARYALFDATMRDRAVARLQTEADLRGAIDRRELRLHYQPIISLRSGRVTGFEALLRWQHPTRGLVSPMEFIPVAEEAGLIVPMGRWVLRQACKQARQWQPRYPADPPLTVSVNLSPRQFAQPDLVDQIESVLHETGLEPRCLGIEITETVLIEDSDAAHGVLQRLRALGVELRIDDFGTGYSSLVYLQRFPVHALKIDHSFIGKMSASGTGASLVRSILALAHDLGMRVIAEGVETADCVAALRDLGCDYAQGHHFSQALDGQAATALIATLHGTGK